MRPHMPPLGLRPTMRTRLQSRHQNGSMAQTVRLMSEYGVDWPLWDEGGTDREDWPQLSDDLAADLVRWNSLWLDGNDGHGWANEKARDLYVGQATLLVERLQAELGQSWIVTVGPLN